VFHIAPNFVTFDITILLRLRPASGRHEAAAIGRYLSLPGFSGHLARRPQLPRQGRTARAYKVMETWQHIIAI
jgi:hypothetical protein